ncbi:MAG TPA: protein kinase, partial [Candidatus Krumholzibacteria bacterium]|nr:protein kinase [Candidatus Krumholzibacteria bacterium]
HTDDDATRTIAVHETAEGRILGTAAYMSPEQAEGKPVDPRSDVFSLGILLYEMATGRKPFDGETAISTISSIVKEQPRSALEVNRGLPRHLGRMLDRCLAKDPDRRYQSAIELRNELELLDQESKSGELEMWVPSSATGESRAARRGVPLAAFGAALLAVAVAAFFATRAFTGSGVAGDDVAVTHVEPLTLQGNVASYPSLSPSGDLFAYQAVDGGDLDIFLQRIGGQRPINLTADHDGLDRRPAISPDGERIVFESSRGGGGIHVMGTTGESVRRVVENGHDPAWSPDGTRIVYTTSLWSDPAGRNTEGVLWIVEIDGGTPRVLTDASMDAVQPDWSPDGRRVVFWSVGSPSGRRDLWSIGVDGTGLVRLTDDEPLDYSPRFGPDGRSVWFVSNRTGTYNLWRLSVDPRTGAPTGVPAAVTMPNDELSRIDVKADRIVFAAPDNDGQAVRIDLPARADALGTVRPLTRGTLFVQRPRLSPDGTRVVFFTPVGTGFQDIYVVDGDGSDLRRLTEDPLRDRGVSWHPDGERLVFYTDRSGSYEIWTMRADGSDARMISDIAERGLDSPWYPRISADGTLIATVNEAGVTIWDLDPATGMMTAPRVPRHPSGLTFFSAADWHPRRSLLLGWIGEAIESSASIWIYDLDDEAWTELVIAAGARGWQSMDFSPDGETVYVQRPDDAIVAVDLADAPLPDLFDPRARVVAEDIPAFGIDVAPDGRWLLTGTRQQASEIWGATLATGDGE